MPVTGGKRRRADEDSESEERKVPTRVWSQYCVYYFSGKEAETKDRQGKVKDSLTINIIHNYRVLYEYESIGYTEDKWHTLIRMIPENINECSRVSIVFQPHPSISFLCS